MKISLDKPLIMLITIGVIITISSALTLVDEYSDGPFLYLWIPYVVFLISAILSIADPKRSMVRSASIYAVAVGINDLILGTYNIYAGYGGGDEDMLLINLIFLVNGLVFLALGVALVVGGLTYLHGRSKSAAILYYPVLLTLATDAVSIILQIRYGYDIPTLIADNKFMFPRIICCIAIAVLMSRKDIRKNTLNWKMEERITGIKTSLFTEPIAFIIPEDVSVIEDWLSTADDTELTVKLRLPNKKIRNLIFYRVPGNKQGYLTLSEPNISSYSGSFRMPVNSIVHMTENNSVRLYGTDGLFSQILIDNINQKK
ncbi:MAG: hypothetical protein M0P07_02715 [Candidatus Methanomethylophilaceae archaeon]|nr:hypothetical protein [Candidatus Methanomethylophilaceae archaeon]MDD3379340.1 hypothetical protein [Candidatus Methanomethylophilaceae archaeon]